MNYRILKQDVTIEPDRFMSNVVRAMLDGHAYSIERALEMKWIKPDDDAWQSALRRARLAKSARQEHRDR